MEHEGPKRRDERDGTRRMTEEQKKGGWVLVGDGRPQGERV